MSTNGEIKAPLTAEERSRFRAYEEDIQEGLGQFLIVGRALLAIRDQRLYRADHSTFESYCESRWHLSARRINQFVKAAQVRDELAESEPMVPKLPLPSNERQIRPLTSLPAEQRRPAWAEAVEMNNGKEPSGIQVQEVVCTYKASPQPTPVEYTTVRISRFIKDEPEELADELAREFSGDRWRTLFEKLREWDDIKHFEK